jgi:Tctex-1 family
MPAEGTKDSSVTDLANLKEEINSITLKTIERTIGQENYQAKMVQSWVDTIGQETVSRFKDLANNYKFVVSVTIVQKTGGLVQSSTCYWDSSTDCHVTVRWENSHLHCVVVAYAVSF